MSEPLTEALARRVGNSSTNDLDQVHNEVTYDRYRDLRRSRKVLFFINGDRYFRGKKIYVTPNLYYTFNDLLSDLTGKLPSNLNLPYGVRQIFTPVGGRRISAIEDLTGGETYVCAGFEGFRMIKYGRAELEPWSIARPQQQPNTKQGPEYCGSYRYRGYAFHPGRYFRTSHAYQQRRWPETFAIGHRGAQATNQSQNMTNKPKVITVVRNGVRPRANVKILLNRRSVQSYEQLVSDISEAFRPKVKNGKVRKLFTVRGKEVVGISDFFREDDCFIALGIGESNLSETEVLEILKELYPDENVAKGLVREWGKNQRRRRKVSPVGQSMKSNKEENNSGIHQVSPMAAGQVPDKKDSGFDSSGASTHRSEGDQTDRQAHLPKPLRRPKRYREAENEKENQLESGRLSPPPQGYYLMKELEKEGGKMANEARERTKRRQQKTLETERRILMEERRKRGLVPLKNIENPFKKMDDIREKQKEELIRRKREEKRRKEEERIEREKVQEKKGREEAERAARERMALAEKAEREKDERLKEERLEEKQSQDREKKEQMRQEGEETKTLRSEKATAAARKLDENDIGPGVSVAPVPAVAAAYQENQAHKEENVTAAAEAMPANAQDEVDAAATITATAEEEVDKDRNNNQQFKVKRKQDKQQRKRGKIKVIRKTREERLVSSDHYILDRYELAGKLGDGNFAIVRHSRKKETGQELAIKVIDKAKLRGKEYMVENEIDIMKSCNHPNIVRLYEEYETVSNIYLVMELVKGGDLFDAITQSVKFGEGESALMVKDLCSALFYMHSRSIVHRDLKPENLLVHRNKDGSIHLKLADFGLAMEVKELMHTVCGTPTYVAPEILNETGYGIEVDMWAVGVITYILLCGFPPFRSPDRNQTELFEFIKAGEYEFLSPYWDNTSRSAKDLISQLLIVDRKRRYTAVDVLSHKWIVYTGQPDPNPERATIVDAACKETRRELQEQAKLNYVSYQRLKDKKKERL